MSQAQSMVRKTTGQLTNEVLPDVARLRNLFVNAYFVGLPHASEGGWVLVDAGLPGYASTFLQAAQERFGRARPAAIVLTHGHFDHVGALRTLAERWDVPIYAHRLELPYLTGRSSYPPPDPFVGGAMALLSPLYPRRPIHVERWVQELPADGTIPGLPDWRWIATPGHSPGHISLYREQDKTLIVGDAFVTQQQESLWAVLTETPHVHRPPAYFTCNWQAAGDSVRKLAALEPELAATGHGLPLGGPALREQLHALADHFAERAIPTQGRYAHQPAAADEHGVLRALPPTPPRRSNLLVGIGLSALAGLWLVSTLARGRGQRKAAGR